MSELSGGLHILLKFPDEVSCSSFVTNNDLWNKWFAVLDVWLGQSLPFERIAWINMIGVPIHLAVGNVYDSIVSRFGKVIHGSNRSVADSDLSVNCVGVLVGEGARINEQVDLRWDNKSYRVWVEEEVTGWVPDCLDVDDTSEVGAPSVEELKSVRQFPVKPPVVDNHVSGFQADPVTSLVDEQSSLHGDTNRPSASHCMDVGPEKICHEEREDDFVFNVADKPRKFKRRPINRSPFRERMNLDQTSPLDDGRVKKRPRPSESDPFDLDRFINNWNILSEAPRLEQGSIQGAEGRVPDLNRRACSLSKEMESGQIVDSEEVAAREDGDSAQCQSERNWALCSGITSF
ncbi:hypothetical protein HanHA300_Chr02g0070441 [Helianthus annuus]|nr:hypothetical protein HanHA300_Chr02g0070441 [Helianthus annuus]KAJ0617064.1 hypothetical protein HanIR_Chr02g0097391 [Helianthus annuus]KAJ0778576.1 hypothetical protein HanLR1_Chr02g0073191 [Helianthus annuus]KAJ0953237.1 hypothetical protein HanPSC8_Chr02g0081571 [Helianthus annuus]